MKVYCDLKGWGIGSRTGESLDADREQLPDGGDHSFKNSARKKLPFSESLLVVIPAVPVTRQTAEAQRSRAPPEATESADQDHLTPIADFTPAEWTARCTGNDSRMKSPRIRVGGLCF